MVTTQQEKLLGEKEVVIERQKHELQAVKDDLAKKLDEVHGCTLPCVTMHTQSCSRLLPKFQNLFVHVYLSYMYM
jgi:hypothetical protein